MEITGKIVQINQEQSGQGRNGTWRKQDYILETTGNYPKKVCLTVWGDKIDQFGIQQGEDITAGIEIESREFNGRWYTDVKVWRVDKGQGAPPANSGNATNSGTQAVPDVSSFSEDSGEDVLPF